MDGFYRRRLPHWQPDGASFFVTFHLAQSVPAWVRKALQAGKEEDALVGGAFGQFDAWLDRVAEGSPRWLAEEGVARIVATELRRLDGDRYDLLAYCLMPNHVHLLIRMPLSEGWPEARLFPPLTEVLRTLKGRTARYGNQVLKRRGAFWQHESYDHVIRDDEELKRVAAYIVNNPVKAGLVRRWDAWPWTYVKDGTLPLP